MTVTVMSDEVLLHAFGELLDAAGVGMWRPDGPAFAFTDVGIFAGPVDESVDSGIGLTIYDWGDPYPVGVSTRRVQVRYRGPRDEQNGANRLASAGFTALQGLARVAGLSLVRRVAVAPLGTDANSRQERADSYFVILDNPEALT